MPLPAGKLPPDLLAQLIGRIPPNDGRVVIGSRPGVDAAAVRMGDGLLIATADPITFVSARAGWYAVHVNANDVAVMGGVPRWMLATVLLPEGVEPEQVEELHNQLLAACQALGITLIGGHTEVTVGLDRPLIAGAMLGEATAAGLVTPAARPGDRLLITKGVAIEGGAALAAEPEALRRAGLSEEAIAAAAQLLDDPGISVVRDVAVLCDAVRPHALHDATEGGLATALAEVAAASGVGLQIEAERIPVLPACQVVCTALAIDPFGLLASGCLIAAIAPEDEPAAVAALMAAGIAVAVIGEATPPEAGLVLTRDGAQASWPVFARDELARWLSGG